MTIPGNIDLVVQFNEAINPYQISTSDFQLSQGTVMSAVPLTPEAVDLTIAGVTQDGTLTLTIPAGLLLDSTGFPTSGSPAITSLTSCRSLIPRRSGRTPRGQPDLRPLGHRPIGFVGDTDTYTLPLAAGQTLSLVMVTDPA